MEEESDSKYNRAKERSPSPGIKSTAVVKYTAFPSPVSYARLQCNTDLNLPPSNWGAAIDSYGLKQILTGTTPLSSFRMAHMFPDCVGAVDVISGAECIKKLLKLPYQPNGTVSMMVHRVENTLLLDDFDVYDYLMKSEWGWLKDFFYENILKTMSEKERMSLTPPPTHNALQLTHKFLSHSVCSLPETKVPTPGGPTPGPYLPEPETRSEPTNEVNDHLYNRNVLWTFEDIQMLIGSDLPIFGDKDRPCVSLRLRDARDPINVLTGIDYWLDNLMCNVPEVLMCYHLDGIVQKYEPMKTEDLPNMENSKFSPKVVRNVAQNILSFLKYNATKAGHTYWLFKGPRDDVVKLYDLTSLCPDSLDNPFTTPVAMLLYRVARNMRLTNRSKHVRQLLEQAINLLKVERYPQIVASSHYMLADLFVPATTNPACPDFKDESSDSESEDPDFEPTEVTSEQDAESVKDETESFKDTETDDMNEDGDSERRDNGDGGDKTKDKSDVKNGVGDDGDKVDVKASQGDGDGEEKSLALQMRGLALRDIGDKIKGKEEDNKRKGREGKGLGVDPPDRCGAALRHALKGLLALHNVTIDKCQEEERERLKEKILIEEQHPKMANPFEPISMNYESIKLEKTDAKEHNSRNRRRKREKKNSKSEYLIEANSNIDKNAILVRKEQKNLPSWNEPNRDDNFAWKLHLKTLLYEKICLAYATLAEYSYAHEQYGFSLKYIDLASKCQKLLSNMIIKSKVVDSSCLIGRVGDNFFQLSKNWRRLEQFRKQFETDHDIDSKIKLEIENDLVEEVDGVLTNEFDLDISLPDSELSSMLACCSYYRLGLSATSDKRAELRRRLASVTNELAVRYMNDAQQIYAKYNEEDPQDPKAALLLKQFNNLSKRSLECLDEASAIFEQVNDVPNLALLYCNKGRYLRFKAHCDQGSFDEKKRALYNTAEDLYLTALKLVGRGDTGGVRELVQWELSCHLYTRAVLMQDCPGSRPNEVTEVAEAFKHALKYCQVTPGPRQYLYQFRSAMIHHRLGSLYHSQYRITSEEGPKRRALLNSARTHYLSCAHTFAALEDASMFLTARLEHVALCECSAAVSPNLKLKSLQTAIELLRQSHSIMTLLKHRDPEDQKDTPKSEDQDEKTVKNEHSLLSLYENRLHYILKSVIQYCRSKSNKDYDKMTDMYKRLYCASLKIKKDDDLRIYAGSICDVLDAMDVICKEFDSTNWPLHVAVTCSDVWTRELTHTSRCPARQSQTDASWSKGNFGGNTSSPASLNGTINKHGFKEVFTQLKIALDVISLNGDHLTENDGGKEEEVKLVDPIQGNFNQEEQNILNSNAAEQITSPTELTTLDDQTNSSLPEDKHPSSISTVSNDITNIAVASMGYSMGWTSPVNIKLKDGNLTDTPLPAVITTDEEAWIGSLLNLGAIVGPFIGGLLASRIGRKWTLISTSVPLFAGWILIAAATSVAFIYAGRFMCGVGVGMLFTVSPMYCAEIATDDSRGALGSFLQLFKTMGFLLVYSIGPFISYSAVAYVGVAFVAAFNILFFFMPETPIYHLSKNDRESAANCLMKIRGQSRAGVEVELDILATDVANSMAKTATIADVFRGSNFKAIYICCALFFFQQFCGIVAVLFYMTNIFEAAGSDLDSSISTIIIGAVQVGASCVTPFVVDRLGRRLLLLFSACGTTIGMALLGLFFFLAELDSPVVPIIGFLPILSLVVFIITYSVGLGSLPWAMMGELFPIEVKAVAAPIATAYCCALSFLVTRFFGPIADAVGMYVAFWIFGVCCIIAFFFTLFVVPETKGKSFAEIQEMLSGNQMANSQVHASEARMPDPPGQSDLDRPSKGKPQPQKAKL